MRIENQISDIQLLATGDVEITMATSDGTDYMRLVVAQDAVREIASWAERRLAPPRRRTEFVELASAARKACGPPQRKGDICNGCIREAANVRIKVPDAGPDVGSFVAMAQKCPSCYLDEKGRNG